jgi:NUMOD4 motif-containing protein/HNH endonuclease
MNEVTPERWCWIPGYEGLYRISDTADIWSFPRATTRGGLLKHVIGTAGYHWVTLTKDGKQARFQVHRLVLAAFDGPCPEGQEARHLDGNPANNRWEPGTEEERIAAGGNLIWGTHSENILDKHRHGTDSQLNKTRCPKDHEYTPENTTFNGKGGRVCLTCKREKALQLYYRKRDAGLIPKYSEQSPEKLARTRELSRERTRRYEQRKRSQKMQGL